MEIATNNLHHAYLVLGDKKETDNIIGALFNKLGIESIGNPDVVFWTGEKFGIDEARVLKARAESKAFVDKKIFVISSTQITPEAQNALLKLFEEPTQNTHFFILSRRNNLLPTLLSRLQLLDLHSGVKIREEVEEFLKSDISERLQFIKNNLDDESFYLPDFLEELVVALKEHGALSKDKKKTFDFIKFSNDPAANTRMILEHLALTLPLSLE